MIPGSGTPFERFPELIARSRAILDSYRHWTGLDLLPPQGSELADAEALFAAPFVVVAHGAEPDPLLNYGNRAALQLWEIGLDDLLGMPSRLTAEPVERSERARMLRQSREHGWIQDYRGVRVSTTGRRFEICRATVWNLLDAQGNPMGQAATFAEWKDLPEG